VLPLPPFESREHFSLTDRERRLSRQLDGERTVEALVEESGKGADWTLRALGAWLRLGWVQLRAPEAEVTQGDRASAARLSAKWVEAEEADYFAILGLSRQADRSQVQQAFEQLAREFNPLHFGTHPDPQIRSRAEQLRALLQEAAQVLSDDRLRAEYARNLLD
jgi:hypothetical protein